MPIIISIPVYNTCTLLQNNVKYVDAYLDVHDNAISDNESSSICMCIHQF